MPLDEFANESANSEVFVLEEILSQLKPAFVVRRITPALAQKIPVEAFSIYNEFMFWLVYELTCTQLFPPFVVFSTIPEAPAVKPVCALINDRVLKLRVVPDVCENHWENVQALQKNKNVKIILYIFKIHYRSRGPPRRIMPA